MVQRFVDPLRMDAMSGGGVTVRNKLGRAEKGCNMWPALAG